jgi:DNA-binding Lrp family transcriptional regulator
MISQLQNMDAIDEFDINIIKELEKHGRKFYST